MCIRDSIKEWMPVEITALTGTAVLMLTGILSTRDVLSSFANSGPLTVVCMFIPVSYTHLDVYKRQHQVHEKMPWGGTVQPDCRHFPLHPPASL